MSVRACRRNGCPNVMCDRVSYHFGYICEECFVELTALQTDDIYSFMDSEKPGVDQPKPLIDYSSIFKDLEEY